MHLQPFTKLRRFLQTENNCQGPPVWWPAADMKTKLRPSLRYKPDTYNQGYEQNNTDF